MVTVPHLNWIGANLFLVGTGIVLVTALIRNLAQTFFEIEADHASYSPSQYRRIIWPALATQRFFDGLFGRVGRRFRDKFNLRMVATVLAISVVLNVLCAVYILAQRPDDDPLFYSEVLETLALCYAVFLAFNFAGDLVSVTITRHFVERIAAGRCNFFKYLLYDSGGICLAIAITALPSMIAMISVVFFGVAFNELFRMGLFGSSLGSEPNLTY